MSAYSIRYGEVFGYPTVVLSNKNNGVSVHILLRGARVNNFFVPLNTGQLFDIIAGYQNREEVERGYAAKSFVMAPFSNRIQNGRYQYQKKEYDFSNDGMKKVSHGLVHNADFYLETSIITDSAVTCRLTTDVLGSDKFQAYPFALSVSVTYILQGSTLSIITEAHNIGSIDAPFSTGWHPYFNFPSGINDLVATVDSSNIVLIDEDFIPYPGVSTFSPLENHPSLDFRKGKQIGTDKINVCYLLNPPDSGNRMCSTLYHPKDKIKLTLEQDRGVLYIYTADDFRGDRRDMIAFEPVECITNAFNREELADVITISPGNTKIFNVECSIATEAS